jgi:hypothetical protein
MGRSKNEVKKLSLSCFQEHPVWAWNAGEDGFVSVERTCPLPTDQGTLFLRARLWPPDGRMLDGYVITCGSVYAIGILVNDDEYVFNKGASDLAEIEAARLFTALQTPAFRLFPMRFETDLAFEEYGKVEGIFTVEP